MDGGRQPGGSSGCPANAHLRDAGMKRFLSPFASRDFRLLWTASTISLLGDGVWYVAIGWQTLALSNSATALAVVWLAFTLPHIAMLLFGGVLSDRLPRRRVLLGANIVSGNLRRHDRDPLAGRRALALEAARARGRLRRQ
jgi:MFS family permease